MQMTPPYIRISKGAAYLKVFVQPGASKDSIEGIHGDSLKIKIAAPPVTGGANKRLIEFLSQILNLKKQLIKIEKGETSRKKLLKLVMPPEGVLTLMEKIQKCRN